MKVKISDIKINLGRREAAPEAVQELARSIAAVGLLNPITLDQNYILIAGLHRLEAAKLLGWTEIECTVTGMNGLQARTCLFWRTQIQWEVKCTPCQGQF